MLDRSGWYPPGQVSYPPELPTYLKNVCDLKPIVGVPSDAEVIGIHAVILAANRVSGIPGMHDPSLLMGLADHLFSAQMAKYRSKYSLIVFPSDATYTPPALPAHVPVNLESVSGAPSDEEIIKAQDAVRSYQQFSHAPSMFDPHVNMEVSQHLFNLQMSRYMRHAGEHQPSAVPQAVTRPETSTPTIGRISHITDDSAIATNNAGTGANIVGANQSPHSVPTTHVHELLERSNQLAERFNVPLERSNELAERSAQPIDQSNRLPDHFAQVLERLTQIVEHAHQPTEQSNQLAERFNSLIERFNEVTEQLGRPAEQANRLAERSNQLVEQLNQPLQQSNRLVERFNQLFEGSNRLLAQILQPLQQSNQIAERLNRLIEGFNQPLQKSNEISEKANQLAEQATKSAEILEETMKRINRVLVGIQHAIVRLHKDNTLAALDCLVNEAGETPCMSKTNAFLSFRWLMLDQGCSLDDRIPVVISGVPQDLFIHRFWLGGFLRFYGIGAGLCQGSSLKLIRWQAGGFKVVNLITNVDRARIDAAVIRTLAPTMSSDPVDEACSPPGLPPYLKSVYDLKPIWGVPSDEEVIGIHAVIRMANKVIDVPGMGDSVLLAQLMEHLFNVQMGEFRYHSTYRGLALLEDTTFTPPALPVHVAVQLEPITGPPSEEEIIKVHNAVRSYHHFTNTPSIFDPHVEMELSQHLFNLQMARYTERAKKNRASSAPHKTPNSKLAKSVERAVDVAEETSATNNAGIGANTAGLIQPAERATEVDLHDAIERANRLAENANRLAERSNQLIERSNQLIERSNKIAEHTNQLLERSSQCLEQSNKHAGCFDELSKKVNQHLERPNQPSDQSNPMAEKLTKSAEKLEGIFGNINRVLVRIQHAIVRNHKGNTISALDCLTNEKGEIPITSKVTSERTFKRISPAVPHDPKNRLSVLINDVYQDSYFPDVGLGYFLRFYGIGEELCESTTDIGRLKPGKEKAARVLLSGYLSSCLA
ncbi:unnamed protein product [Rhizoctonia solani]|uniref:Laminin domain protein n=1 Tax=Rhizoctonia solani TaxID=456999 RepID=A0A8H3H308_9AGAM|nr:unnamed protein product [Rhizoctonia solani]